MSKSEEPQDFQNSYGMDNPPPYPSNPGGQDPAYPTGGAYPMQAYPPPANFQGPPVSTTVVLGTSPAYVINQPMFGELPVAMKCTVCDQNITTVVNKNTGILTWLVAGGVCLFGCWLGCCLIPFCVKGLKDSVHICPNCNAQLGIHKKL